MKVRLFIAALCIAVGSAIGDAATLFPDSPTASNEVELGVEGVARLCPTGMWDHWAFRDIQYDKESNTVLMVIQLRSWNGARHEVTEEDAKLETQWIVRNIMEGYNALTASPRVSCDGDFMLYLSLGILLKQMEKDGATLRIALLKPDYENLAIQLPLSLTPDELKSLTNQ